LKVQAPSPSLSLGELGAALSNQPALDVNVDGAPGPRFPKEYPR